MKTRNLHQPGTTPKSLHIGLAYIEIVSFQPDLCASRSESRRCSSHKRSFLQPQPKCQETPMHLAETDVIRYENTKTGKIRDDWDWVYRHYGLMCVKCGCEVLRFAS